MDQNVAFGSAIKIMNFLIPCQEWYQRDRWDQVKKMLFLERIGYCVWMIRLLERLHPAP